MISPLARLACRRDELDEEIQKLCTQLGALTQERFIIMTGIRALVDEEPVVYSGVTYGHDASQNKKV